MSSLAHASASSSNPDPRGSNLDDLFSFEASLGDLDTATPNPWDPLAAYTKGAEKPNSASVQSRETIGVLLLGGLFFIAIAWGLFSVAFPSHNSPIFSLLNQPETGNQTTMGPNGTPSGGYSFPVVEETTMEVIDPNGNSKDLPIGTSIGVLAKARGSGSIPAVSFGRSDPFMPLVTSTDVIDGTVAIKPIEVEFIGIIKDTSNATNPRHVAMLQTKGDNPQTLIKEAGDDFIVNGQNIRIQSVHPERVELVADDTGHTLMLKSYTELYTSQNATAQPRGRRSFKETYR